MGRIDDLDFLKKEERWAGYANFMEEQGLDPITGEKQSADYMMHQAMQTCSGVTSVWTRPGTSENSCCVFC